MITHKCPARAFAHRGLILAACALLAGPVAAQNPEESNPQPAQGGAPTMRMRDRGWIPPVMSMHRTEDEVEVRDGIKYVILSPGKGPDITDGCYVGLEFNVFNSQGELIYASRQPGAKAAGVRIPDGELWPAWADAMMGMKRYEVRKILIPKEFGPGPQGHGPIPGNTDLVIELGVFAVLPQLDPIAARIAPDGSRSIDLVPTEADAAAFEKAGFGDFHINVFNDLGELMGSSTISRFTITASGNSERYWVKYALGMKSGGSRVVEFDEPEAYRKLRLSQSSGNASQVDQKPRRWRILIDCFNVTVPITQTPHNPADEKDLGEGVRMVELAAGEGEPFDGNYEDHMPVIHYASWSAVDGSLVDSSRKPGREKVVYNPLYPSIWKKALTGMRKGGKRKLIVPPNIDKGQDFTPISDDRGFIYELEMLDWEDTIFKLTNEGEGGFFDFSDDGGGGVFDLGGDILEGAKDGAGNVKPGDPQTKPADKETKPATGKP